MKGSVRGGMKKCGKVCWGVSEDGRCGKRLGEMWEIILGCGEASEEVWESVLGCGGGVRCGEV